MKHVLNAIIGSLNENYNSIIDKEVSKKLRFESKSSAIIYLRTKLIKMKNTCLLLLLLISLGCQPDDVTPDNQPNILLIIADDMGKDATDGYPEGSIKPNTPNLNSIREQGLKFNNCWVYPVCTPTRVSMMTGKYGYRTGVKWVNEEMSTSENTLHNYITENTDSSYATALIGKWHLSGLTSNRNPETFGIDYYAGLVGGGVQDYYEWPLSEGGVETTQTEYITEVFTDLSIDWINAQEKPWFLWLAYNAPHTPFHVPPSEMHSQGSLPEYTIASEATPYYMAAIEAMDYQIGRLMDSMSAEELENTIIIFIGDNGTPLQVAQAPYTNNSAKGTLYQGGINVPLFISGKGVNRVGEDNSLIAGVDLFSTIAQLAGVNSSSIHDSKSFKTLLDNAGEHRNYQYSETNNAWTISNGDFKLIIKHNGNEEFYNLNDDPYETANLLNDTLTTAEENAKIELEAELSVIRN